MVLLPETSIRGALRCAERVRQAVVRRPFEGLHHVTVSIGIAEYRPGETVSSLIGRADEALYGAKHAGRNRVHCATTDGGPNAIVMPSFLDATVKGTGRVGAPSYGATDIDRLTRSGTCLSNRPGRPWPAA